MLSTNIKGGIYLIKNTINGNTYVGQTGNFAERWGHHKRALRNNVHFNPIIQSDYDSLGIEVFEFSILEVLNADRDVRILKEKEYINNISPTYNIFTSKYKRTPEHCLKISEAKTGKSSIRKGVSLWSEERPHPNLGKKHSVEAAEASSRTQNPEGYHFLSPSGEYFVVRNLSAFCRERGLDVSNMSKVSKGKVKSYKKWTRYEP